MEITYSEKAVKQLKQIAKGDKRTASRILAALENYAGNPKGTFDVKVLKGKYAVFKRLRVGDYRVIFDDDGDVMFIYEVKHRQEAYHD
jgi:mRNA interferase RelE/StbE